MQPFFWRPDPPPQQRRPTATLPAAVGSEPPRRGPLAVAVLAATVAAWPMGGQAQVPHRDLSYVHRGYLPQGAEVVDQPRPTFPAAIQRAWEGLTWAHQHAPHTPQGFEVIDPPPPRRAQLVLVPSGGVFYPQYVAVPMRLPSGIPPLDQVDAPPPYVPLPPQVLARWVPTWDAQRVRTLTPESVEAPVSDTPPPLLRLPEAVHVSWREAEAVALPLGGVPLEVSGDQPPVRVLPRDTWHAWAPTWDAQRQPVVDYSVTGDVPTPFRPLPPQVVAAWIRTWETQRASVSAAWDVPPQAAGDEIPPPRRLDAHLLEAWQPLFVLPPRAPTFDARPVVEGDAPPPRAVLPNAVLEQWVTTWSAQARPITFTLERVGDDPPPFVRLPASLVQAWVQTWAAQTSARYQEGLTTPPVVAKGFLVRHESGVLYRVVYDGHEYYAVRVT